MKTVLVLALLLMLPACGSVPGMVLPSIDACERVSYERSGDDVTIIAECKVDRG